MTRAALVFLAAFVLAPAVSAEPPKLGLPISCTVGKTCWVQNYADQDSSSGIRDYACGSQTYDGHDGTDIRVRDTASSADVIATAGGTVKAVRDGVGDHLLRTNADREAVADVECGNGVLIAHDDGWETQYCHLRQDSISVKPGDAVTQGQKLGLVGYSGMAEFPHVHLAVRKNNKDIDPFNTGDNQAPCGQPQDPLWTEDALAALSYKKSDVLSLGFAAAAVRMEELEKGQLGNTPSAEWPAMVAYVWAINLQQGDVVNIRLDGPDGIESENSIKLDRAKAQYLLFAGKKRPNDGWPKGVYRARVEVSNASEKRLAQESQVSVD